VTKPNPYRDITLDGAPRWGRALRCWLGRHYWSVSIPNEIRICPCCKTVQRWQEGRWVAASPLALQPMYYYRRFTDHLGTNPDEKFPPIQRWE
jgi:hypothetical protein